MGTSWSARGGSRWPARCARSSPATPAPSTASITATATASRTGPLPLPEPAAGRSGLGSDRPGPLPLNGACGPPGPARGPLAGHRRGPRALPRAPRPRARELSAICGGGNPAGAAAGDPGGGGLRRSAGGWAGVRALRRGREAYRGEERILGQTAFVEQIRAAAEAALPAPAWYRRVTLDRVLARVCAALGLAPGGRAPALSRAREGMAYLWTTVLGRPGRPLAAMLGTRPAAV